MTLREIARALGGKVAGREVLAPGPGHSSGDRSMWVRPSPAAPDGFLCGSFAGDDWQSCKDLVRERLRLPAFELSRRLDNLSFGDHNQVAAHAQICAPSSQEALPADDVRARTEPALRIWREAKDPRGTIVEIYLRSRGLELTGDVAGEVLRFQYRCPWREGDALIYVPAMIALLRDIKTNEPTGIHRTRLTPEAAKVDRRMLGPAAGAAIKLDADDAVTMAITVGEGIETCLSARQIGLRPVWALGSSGAIAGFPVLAGIGAVTFLAERDVASAKAIDQCGQLWRAASREVIVATPLFGSDLNDSLPGIA